MQRSRDGKHDMEHPPIPQQVIYIYMYETEEVTRNFRRAAVLTM